MVLQYSFVKKYLIWRLSKVLYDIDDFKVSDIDGYDSVFFKRVWSVIGKDIYNVIRNFFWLMADY